MKRIITLLTVLLILFALVACTSNEQPTDEPTQTTEPEQTTEHTMLPGVADLENPIEDPFASNTEGSTEPSNPNQNQTTDSQNPEQNTTDPTEKQEDPSEETVPPTTEGNNEMGSTIGVTDYEKYLNMSGQEQMKFQESFGSMEAFFDWLIAARDAYESANPDIDIEDGTIDLGGGNG